MKVAIPTRGNVVDDHFGHCEMYTIFTIGDEKTIVDFETLPSPQGCGCKSNIASVLKEMGVSVMLAGNMGGGALNVLNSHGIQVIRGCSGDVRQLVETYLKGYVIDSGIGCQQHEKNSNEEHVCNHH
jgi:predicted Fe-Mo cluster-binding NifX family protein